MINIEKQNALPHSELLRILNYDPLSGIFTWKVQTGRVKVGERAGTLRKDGYYIIMISKKKYKLNRLALFYMNGVWPVGVSDHKNGMSNAYENLRDATDGENQQNQNKPHSRNKSKSNVPGVSFFRGKWVIRLTIDMKHIRFGKYDNQTEAEEECIRLRRIHYKGNLL